MQTISLAEALKIFNQRDAKGMFVPFNISVRTFSRTTKKGGQLKVYEGVKYLPPANPEDDEQAAIHDPFAPTKVKRDPKHFENRTRNIELPSGDIKKINIDFIILINDFKVIY